MTCLMSMVEPLSLVHHALSSFISPTLTHLRVCVCVCTRAYLHAHTCTYVCVCEIVVLPVKHFLILVFVDILTSIFSLVNFGYFILINYKHLVLFCIFNLLTSMISFVAEPDNAKKKKKTKRKPPPPVHLEPSADAGAKESEDGVENQSDVESVPLSPESAKPLASVAFGPNNQSNPTEEEVKKNVSLSCMNDVHQCS